MSETEPEQQPKAQQEEEEFKEADAEETKEEEQETKEEDEDDEDDDEDDDEGEEEEQEEQEEKEDEDEKPKAKKQRRAPKRDVLKMFDGNHAKVLLYYMELGNFKVLKKYDSVDEHGQDNEAAVLVVPRKTGAKAMRTFRSRFGKHFRALGYCDLREGNFAWCDDNEVFTDQNVAYLLKGPTVSSIDLKTLEPVRDRVLESMDMLEADVFA